MGSFVQTSAIFVREGGSSSLLPPVQLLTQFYPKLLWCQLLLHLLKYLLLLFCLLTEEFLGMSPLPCANVKFPQAAEKASAPAALEGSQPSVHKGPSGESWAILPPELAPAEGSPSESSESVSLVTQIANPASVPVVQLQTGVQPSGNRDLSQRLLEATSEEQSPLPKPPEPGHPSAAAQEPAVCSEQTAVTGPKEVESKAQGRTETLKEEGPTDLRVFELNSDSGKSTPSNNGKKGACGPAPGLEICCVAAFEERAQSWNGKLGAGSWAWSCDAGRAARGVSWAFLTKH